MNKIIKKFKGGSLSSTVLMESYNGQFFVRKSVSLKENREYGFQRWYSQLKRIQRYSVLFPGLFPKLINFGKDKNQAYMDIEYFNNAINAQEYIKSCKNKKDIDIFFDLLMKSINKMHKVKIDSSNNAIDLYLNEEVDQKLKDCLADKKFSIFLRAELICGITSSSLTKMGLFARFRRAVCKTALFSVSLMIFPENCCSIASFKSTSSTSCLNNFMVSSLMIFLEKSTRISSKTSENLLNLFLSFSNKSVI